MKIRIKDNTVRLRLSQNEVIALVQNGETWSTCAFPSSILSYGIIATDESEISSNFSEGKVTTRIPKSTLNNWDTDERVGFNAQTDGLFILIEKDWQCLKPREHEDESNLFVNPQA